MCVRSCCVICECDCRDDYISIAVDWQNSSPGPQINQVQYGTSGLHWDREGLVLCGHGELYTAGTIQGWTFKMPWICRCGTISCSCTCHDQENLTIHIDGLVQERYNSSALAMELHEMLNHMKKTLAWAWLIYGAQSVPWLLMSWWHKEPGHQQPWCWPNHHGI